MCCSLTSNTLFFINDLDSRFHSIFFLVDIYCEGVIKRISKYSIWAKNLKLKVECMAKKFALLPNASADWPNEEWFMSKPFLFFFLQNFVRCMKNDDAEYFSNLFSHDRWLNGWMDETIFRVMLPKIAFRSSFSCIFLPLAAHKMQPKIVHRLIEIEIYCDENETVLEREWKKKSKRKV